MLMIKVSLNNEHYHGGREMGRLIHGRREYGLVYIVYNGLLYYFCSDKKENCIKSKNRINYTSIKLS